MKNYKHLKQNHRDRIQLLRDQGHTQEEIAKVLKVCQSTISREIGKNRKRIRRKKGVVLGPYLASLANHKSYVRRKYSKYQGKSINDNDKLKRYIVRKLKRFWSPDSISGRMKKDREPFYASKTAIYEWLRTNRGNSYCKYLYSKRYDKKKQKENKTKRTLIPNRIGIENRPKEALRAYGHYEGDTMVSGKKTGSKAALSVVYEKKAKYIDARKITRLSPKENNKALKEMNEYILTKTYTLDNGIENTRHEELPVPAYFCDPYSAWQKGGVEGAVKQIRRFMPKGSDISNYSDGYVRIVIDILNKKPRKSLGYKTPYEVMKENNLFKPVNFNQVIIKNLNRNYALRG